MTQSHSLTTTAQGDRGTTVAAGRQDTLWQSTGGPRDRRAPRGSSYGERTVERRSPIWTVAGAATAMVLLALVGCADAGEAPKPRASTPAAPAATSNSREAEAQREVLAVYDGYRNANVRAAATADHQSKELGRYVGEPLLGQLVNNLYVMSQNGIVSRGRPTWSPKVTMLRLNASPPTAEIVDCFDTTNWNAVFKATGKSAAAPGQTKRFKVSAVAKQVGGRWYIVESRAERTTPC